MGLRKINQMLCLTSLPGNNSLERPKVDWVMVAKWIRLPIDCNTRLRSCGAVCCSTRSWHLAQALDQFFHPAAVVEKIDWASVQVGESCLGINPQDVVQR